jgi:hypothetical protein
MLTYAGGMGGMGGDEDCTCCGLITTTHKLPRKVGLRTWDDVC